MKIRIEKATTHEYQVQNITGACSVAVRVSEGLKAIPGPFHLPIHAATSPKVSLKMSTEACEDNVINNPRITSLSPFHASL